MGLRSADEDHSPHGTRADNPRRRQSPMPATAGRQEQWRSLMFLPSRSPQIRMWQCNIITLHGQEDTQEMRKSWSQLQNCTGEPEFSRQFTSISKRTRHVVGHELLTGVQRSRYSRSSKTRGAFAEASRFSAGKPVTDDPASHCVPICPGHKVRHWGR